jgi:hypothetical protein
VHIAEEFWRFPLWASTYFAPGFTPTPAAGPARRTAILRHEGDVWSVVCEGELTRLKDMKGVAYLLELLRHPGQEFHALDLGGAEDLRTGDAGELRAELQEAEEFHDIGRAARLREEMEVLVAEWPAPACSEGARARRGRTPGGRA